MSPAPATPFAIGERVSIATSSSAPEAGTFAGEAGPYFDGTRAAWVQLDGGPVAFLPMADLSPWRPPRRLCPVHRTLCTDDLCAEACAIGVAARRVGVSGVKVPR